jgi:hypothetical protein
MPAMVRTDASNPFAHHTMQVRVPATAREVLVLNPDYSPAVHIALEALAAAIETDQVMPPLEATAPDYELWREACAAHTGQTWLQTDWFYSEVYFYRLLVSATRWWETGRDLFAPQKTAELSSLALWQRLEEALELRAKLREERLQALIHLDLWGNRIDLSFAASLARGTDGSHHDLLVDDSAAVVTHLMAHPGGEVHIVADNTGTELALDLALCDALLDEAGTQVIFHVKVHPMFVSDALPSDWFTLVRQMTARGGETAALASRLLAAFDAGRVRVIPNGFWNSSYPLSGLTPVMRDVFSRAALVVLKGDLNYRRMVGDVLWPVTTPFRDVVRFMPAPLLAMRTLKSELLVGLAAGQAEALAAEDAKWQTNGKRGVIQFRA